MFGLLQLHNGNEGECVYTYGHEKHLSGAEKKEISNIENNNDLFILKIFDI